MLARIISCGALALIVGGAATYLALRPGMVATKITAPGQNIDWTKVEDDPSEHLTISMVSPSKSLLADAHAVRVLEEAFNVTLDITTVDPAAYSKKKPMLLAAGEIPDIFAEQAATMPVAVKHGFVIPIPRPLIRRHAPSLARMVNSYAPYAWRASEVGGLNYAIPTLWPGSRYPRVGIWRMDWLKRLGFDAVPTTIDEYEAVFKAVVEQDPDGDGKADTYGMSGDLSSWYMMFTEIFGAHGVMPFSWQLDGDEVVWGGIHPDAKVALARLNSWYEKGYIHPDFVTDRWHAEINNKLFDGTIAYHNYMASYEAFNPDDPSSVLNRMLQLDPDAELVPAIVPTGPKGHRGHRVWGANHGFLVFGRDVAAKPQAVIRVLRMIEALMANEDLYVAATIGEEGTHWKWAEGGRGSGIVALEPYASNEDREAQGLAKLVFIEGNQLVPAYLTDAVANEYLPAGKVDFRKRFTDPSIGRQDLFGNPQPIPELATVMERLIAFQQTAYAEFVVGDRSLETFDDFVAEWKALGGQEILDRIQGYHGEMLMSAQDMGWEGAAP